MRGSLVLLLLLVVGCNQSISESIPFETGPDPYLYFCKQDNCTKQLDLLLNRASQSIYCALFDLEEPQLIQSFNEKKSEGVDVRVVVDNKHDPGLLTWAVRDTSRDLMHNKFCVIDGEIVWTGSYNPTSNGNNKNENHGIVLYSSILATNYEDEFEELYAGVYGGGEPAQHPITNHSGLLIENYFCPEDRCEQQLVSHLEQAQHSIYFLQFSFTSKPVGDALLLNLDADIQGVMDPSGAGSPYGQFKRLKEFGLSVSTDTLPGKLHHKVFIIDNQTLITGSYNPSKSGAYKNDENMLVIHHVPTAKKFAQEYFRIIS